MTERATSRLASEAGMPAAVRRARTLELIKSSEYVRVSDLVDRFGISEVTARADLDALAASFEIRRVRGGALAGSLAQERPFEETESSNAAEKLAIARTAAAQVSDGDAVVIDTGTTAAALALALVARQELRDVVVFTNGIKTALALEPAIPRLTVVVLGGSLRPLQHSLVDPLGTHILERVRADIAFCGCNGVDVKAGVTNANLPEAAIKRAMLAISRRRVILADGSKIGKVAVSHLCGLDEIDTVLTGESVDAAHLARIREVCGVTVAR